MARMNIKVKDIHKVTFNSSWEHPEPEYCITFYNQNVFLTEVKMSQDCYYSAVGDLQDFFEDGDSETLFMFNTLDGDSTDSTISFSLLKKNKYKVCIDDVNNKKHEIIMSKKEIIQAYKLDTA